MIRVGLAAEDELDALLRLLEESLREGEDLPEQFIVRFRRTVAAGDSEVLVAHDGGDAVGVAVLSYRLSVAAGDLFASVEELYVRPEARRRGVGGAILEAVGGRCGERGVSYVEVQAVDEAAEAFYVAAGYEKGGVRVMSCSYPL